MPHPARPSGAQHRDVRPAPEVMLQAASRYVAAGVSLIPTGVSGGFAKRPHYEALKKTDHCRWDEESGKWKASWMALHERLPTQDELHAWFTLHRAPGMAMVTGQVSGLLALDFDGQAGAALLHQLGWAPHVRTPSGGYHVYLRHPGWTVATVSSNTRRTLPSGLDVRADGGLAMLPPTMTDSGSYERLPATTLLNRRHVPEVLEVGGRIYRLRELLGLEHAPEDAYETPRAAARPRYSASRAIELRNTAAWTPWC